MVILATSAAIIASVALIFGAYSLASQAIALKLFPPISIIHTDSMTEGQIYIPFVNLVLFIGSVSLVVGFGSATRLAAAYGFAVSGVMCVTSVSMLAIAIYHWKWKPWIAASVFGTFLVLDLGFLVANSVKFWEGGFIPLIFGCFVFLVIANWRWGRGLIHTAYDDYVKHRDIRWFLDLKKKLIDHNGILRDSRTRDMAIIDRAIIFLVSRPVTEATDPIPMNLRLHLKRYGSIPKLSIFLNIRQDRVPYVERHYKITNLGLGVY
jgi:KUP system potassium uptake protein